MGRTMLFCSTKNPSSPVPFRQALLAGLPSDGGLFVPQEIPVLKNSVIQNSRGKSFQKIAFVIARAFIDVREISDEVLQKIIAEAFDFPIPIHDLNGQTKVLELFHGPTLAFKDFAARFMARLVEYFLAKKNQKKTILVATSGDTGGAIGSAFSTLKNVSVVILFPQDGVSTVQKSQLTTLGSSVTAIEIRGSFDDCQSLVKSAFLDPEIQQSDQLMSANSINIGRIIPQIFYYAHASLAGSREEKTVFSVPSGNLGNFLGGVLAQKMGFPIHTMIASQNINHPFVDYLHTRNFTPMPSKMTISNAMDIGHPNNFYRLDHWIYSAKIDTKFMAGFFFSDDETKAEILRIWSNYKYLMCPHTAVGSLGLGAWKKANPDFSGTSIVVSTAHPAKFPETIEPIVHQTIPTPKNLAEILQKNPIQKNLSPDLNQLKNILLS